MLEQTLPGLAALRHVQRADMRHDVAAGLAVAAVAVPVAIAYARLAGFGPEVGLYSSILPLVAYAFTGTSRQLMVGPSAATCALVGAAIAPLAGGDAALAASLSMVLALLVGAFCLAASRLRLGALADFLSRPILIGFMHGVALSIVLGQLGPLFGVTVEAGGILPRLFAFAGVVGGAHLPTLAVGLLTFALLAATPRLLPRVPGELVALVGAGAAVALLDLERAGVATLGPVAAGLPTPRWPSVPPALLPTLVAEAAGLALVCFSSTMIAARSFAARRGDDLDDDAEVAALGVANLATALSQGFVVNGTNSRTAVAAAAGARSQVTGLVAAAAITVVLLTLTAPLRYVPVAAVAAILIGAALSLVDVAGLRAVGRLDRTELWLSLLATVGVVVVGAVNAILVAVALALLRFVRLAARPRSERLDTLAPGLLAFRFNGPLVFFSAPHFRREVLLAAADAGPALRRVVLVLPPANLVDASGQLALREVCDALQQRGLEVGIVGRPPPQLDLPGVRVFASVEAAAADSRAPLA